MGSGGRHGINSLLDASEITLLTAEHRRCPANPTALTLPKKHSSAQDAQDTQDTQESKPKVLQSSPGPAFLSGHQAQLSCRENLAPKPHNRIYVTIYGDKLQTACF